MYREQEKAQQIRLKQVRSEWDHMHTRELPAHVLPNLQEFRKLSVVKIYETGPSGSEQHTLRDPFVSSVLAENLEQWREAARAGLAAVLGFPGWKNLSRRRLHPVDRLTARFRCTRCDAAASSGSKKVPEDGGMDFARACEHVCTHLPKKRRNKEKWSADRFVPDQRVRVSCVFAAHSISTDRVFFGSCLKAVDAIAQVLSLCGTTPEDVDSIRIADELGDRVQCQSCPCIMDVRSVVGCSPFPLTLLFIWGARIDTANAMSTAASRWQTALLNRPSSTAWRRNSSRYPGTPRPRGIRRSSSVDTARSRTPPPLSRIRPGS